MADLRTADQDLPEARDHPNANNSAGPQGVIDRKDHHQAGPHKVVQAAARNLLGSKHSSLLMVKSTLTSACVSKAIRPIACRRTVSNAL